MENRIIILDTETTGLSPKMGHRLIEIGCLEMIDLKLTGNSYQTYIQPCRLVDEGAMRVHGVTDAMLADKPRFKDIYRQFLSFIGDSKLVAHNAQFDMGFINHELSLLLGAFMPYSAAFNIYDSRTIICTKKMAQALYGPGGNKLDELCDKFGINRENRTLHGALIDCELLAEVYVKLMETE